MQDLRVARSFFEAHLPAHLVQRIDFNTLKLESSSFVDQSLQELLSDLLYSVQLAGKQSYLYLLSEHQSVIPELMPFRILQYNCGIMESHLKQIPLGESKQLPLVVNIVFYHGVQTPYVASCDLFDYFTEPELARSMMFKPFILIDVNQIPDTELATHQWAALFEMLQKHSRERDMLPFLEKLLKGKLNIEVHRYSDLLTIMIKYVIETGEVSDKKKFVELLQYTLPQGEQKMTTLAQDWLKEGYEKGIHAGMQQGKLEGMQQGKLKGEHEKAIAIARNLLSKNAAIDFIKEVTGLSDQDIAKLIKSD